MIGVISVINMRVADTSASFSIRNVINPVFIVKIDTVAINTYHPPMSNMMIIDTLSCKVVVSGRPVALSSN